ncbi:C40 family peptidase [Klenkia taihuensis]|uniref:Cell wall-associated hydrolases (Invasion-associated proteins) n=1 Tax=Klenkia taihuensis TaxID=1225127 RepID=A0A1I1UE56_9ACTN|nr:NlpC/P60 family protein [Klenkia taihuensis]GHE06907.1 lipoprotein [Klenkia taihuensis]SFD66230.1 Cell wall-associated hydrolases (invasion-associated proteins) [Klenkia taihuensis]
MTTSQGAAKGVAVAVVPVVSVVTAVLMVLTGGGATPAGAAPGLCAGAGSGQTVTGVELDADQMGHAWTIVSTVAERQLPVRAAVIAVATAYTESRLVNSAVQTDHDSEGLFQQRVSIYTEAVAIDPVRSTNAFLDRMVDVPDWETRPMGDVAQAVQISAYPDRYALHVGLADEVVGQIWPTASSTAGAAGTSDAAAICPGAGGARPVGEFVGPMGGNTTGTTTVPAGLVINGSPQGVAAVQYALAQLGKPYVWAAAGPNSFDCSGLTMAAWAAGGVALPHNAAAQTGHGTPGAINLTDAVGGDLVMIPGAGGTALRPGHVGMVAGYVDQEDGRHLYLVHAPMTGVPVIVTEASRWSGQVVAVRHIG